MSKFKHRQRFIVERLTDEGKVRISYGIYCDKKYRNGAPPAGIDVPEGSFVACVFDGEHIFLDPDKLPEGVKIYAQV